jgi:hypothetical protein
MTTQTAALIISSSETDPHNLQEVTRDLCKTINRETDIEAAIPESPGVAGSKGDAITIGTIVLGFITGGGAVALINVLKAYIDRGSQLEVKFEMNRRSLTINAKNVDSEEIDRTFEKAQQFFSQPGTGFDDLRNRIPEE